MGLWWPGDNITSFTMDCRLPSLKGEGADPKSHAAEEHLDNGDGGPQPSVPQRSVLYRMRRSKPCLSGPGVALDGGCCSI
jgi:hypothetical protein